MSESSGEGSGFLSVPQGMPFIIPRLQDGELLVLQFPSEPMSAEFLQWLESQVQAIPEDRQMVIQLTSDVQVCICRSDQIRVLSGSFDVPVVNPVDGGEGEGGL